MTEHTARDFILDVPYVSQYQDVTDPDERLGACGMACVSMALKYFNAETESLDASIKRGKQEGGYTEAGWVHDYLVGIFHKAGLSCERREGLRDRDVDILRSALKTGNPVIVSAIRRMWDRRSFHMVLLVGVRESRGGTIEGFFYHDPASFRGEGQNAYVPLSVFYLDWRRTAILPKAAR